MGPRNASFFGARKGVSGSTAAGARTLQREEVANSWNNAAIVASNLSETELLVGEIAAATATAKKAVSLADLSADPFTPTKRVTYANVLHAAGEFEIAELCRRRRTAAREVSADQPLTLCLARVPPS